MRRIVLLVLFLVLWVPSAGAWTWPVGGPVLHGFSFDRAHPYAAGQHRGVDVAASDGAPVLAPVSGVVTFAGAVPTSGRSVTIETVDGLSVTLTHLGTIVVARNAAVVEGAVIGAVGTSGTPEIAGPYVHLGVRTTADAQGYLDPVGLLPVLAPPVPAPVLAPPVPAPAPPPPAPDPAAPPAVAPPAAPPAPVGPPVSAAPVASEPPAQGDARAEATPPAAEPSPALAPAVVASPVVASPVVAPAVVASPVVASPVVAPAVVAPAVVAPAVVASPVVALPAETLPAAETSPPAADEPAAPAASVPAPSVPAPSLPAAAPTTEPALPEPVPAAAPSSAPAPEAVRIPAPSAGRPLAPEPARESAPRAQALPGLEPFARSRMAVPPGWAAARPVASAPQGAVPETRTETSRPSRREPTQVAGAGQASVQLPAAAAGTRPAYADAHVHAGAPAAMREHRSLPLPVLAVLVVSAIASLGLGGLAAAGLAAARIIRTPSPTSEGARPVAVVAEDPRRARMAVREWTAPHRPRGGLRRAGGRLRPLPPVEGQRRPDGQRDGRARHTGDGVRRQERRVAA
jgi:hypothetical protein